MILGQRNVENSAGRNTGGSLAAQTKNPYPVRDRGKEYECLSGHRARERPIVELEHNYIDEARGLLPRCGGLLFA